MKILRLRLRNLNSLAGDWGVDFTHADFVTSGIFAITGPTGAGKTTILDGICLALYGQTPRLGRITQGGNELMSRQTGDCSAEVEFETGKGRFRCTWTQHRSRKQPDGKLQPPRHEIAEADSGRILEATLTAVVKLVEEVTGMDFDRFTRSMLLAQGGFAAFLQARPDERAPILEQITGTEIYSLISLKVHERTATERKKVELIQEELKGVQLLSADEEGEARRQLEEKRGADAELAAIGRRLQEEQGWRERLGALEAELVGLEEGWQALCARKSALQPDLELLERARRARVLEAEHARLQAVRRREGEAEAERVLLVERLSRLKKETEEAAKTVASAEVAWCEAEARQLRETELLRAVRDLDTRLEETGNRLAVLERETLQIRHESSGYRLAIAQCDTLRNKAATALSDVDRCLAERSADAGLVESLTGIGERLKLLKALDVRRQEGGERLTDQRESVRAAAVLVGETESSWQRAEEAARVAEEHLQAVMNARADFLGGEALSSWRERAFRLEQRSVRLAGLNDRLLLLAEMGNRLTVLQERRRVLEESRREFLRQEHELVSDDTLHRELVGHLQEKVILLGRVRDLEAERTRLVEGKPCPLCGATEHPYSAGSAPQPDEAQRELDVARQRSEATARRLNDLRLHLVGIEAELKEIDRERDTLEERRNRDLPDVEAGLVEQGLPGEWERAAGGIAAALEACRKEADSVRATISAVEQKEEGERLARGEAEEARRNLVYWSEARQAADLGHRAAAAEQARLEAEEVALTRELKIAVDDAAAAVAPFGLAVAPAEAEAVMENLHRRRREHLERLATREELRRALDGLEGEREKQEALLSAAERNLSDREESLLTVQGERGRLSTQRRELYGDRDPDEGEVAMAASVREARERREGALMAQNRLEAERQGGEDRLAEVRKSLLLIGREREAQEQSFLLRLAAAGFADEADFDAAHLPEERLAALANTSEELQREETEIRARRLDRAETLQREQARELTLRSLEDIVAELTSMSRLRQELQQEVGGIEERLRRHAAQEELLQARLEGLDRQKQECGRWERLHLLIGSSDGKKFRNFAQGLTFELMVAHANRQLQKMSDRYLLIRDEAEPLELNVIDQYQAGETRSTKNLSGGESFIVSLALALGLSSMASRTVRVDSLFLDEGFGTLDEDALETALETLGSLQREGKLIGIISHVTLLQERVGTQIRVTPMNGGRSSLRGPGCSGPA